MYVSEPDALKPAKIDPRTRLRKNGSYSTPARCALAVPVMIVAPMSTPNAANANTAPRRDPPGFVGISARYARARGQPGTLGMAAGRAPRYRREPPLVCRDPQSLIGW
jgi:hypothetical protein